MNPLAQLQALTTVVADTGDFHPLAQCTPRDTTDATLILEAMRQPQDMKHERPIEGASA